MTPATKACRAASRLGRTVDRALGGSELTAAGYRLLAYLATDSSAATTLADKLAVSRPTVTATIDWLEARGYVIRSPDPADRRRVTVAMTAAGEVALERADALVADGLRDVLELMADHEAAAMVLRALDVLHDALDLDRERRASLVRPTPSP